MFQIGNEISLHNKTGKIIKISFSGRQYQFVQYLVKWEDGTKSWHCKDVLNREV